MAHLHARIHPSWPSFVPEFVVLQLQYFNVGSLFTLLAFSVSVAMIPLRTLFVHYLDQHWSGEMEMVFASMSLAQAQAYVRASIAVFVALTIIICMVMVR